MPDEFVDQELRELAAPPRHFRRQFPVAEASTGEAEIPVEGIDQDLVRRLARLGLRPLLRVRRRPRELLVLQAVLKQPPKEGDEHPEGIVRRVAPDVEE